MYPADHLRELLILCWLITLFLPKPTYADLQGKFPGKGDRSAWERSMKIAAQGDARADAGQEKEAEKLYREALRIYPSDCVVYYELGKCLSHQGKYKEATTFLKKSIVIESGFDNNVMLGVAYAHQQLYREAIAAFMAGKRFASTQKERNLIEANLVQAKRDQAANRR